MLTTKTTRLHRGAAVYWLITRNGNGLAEVLTIADGGEERLPVFSFEEEGVMFLSLGAPGTELSLRRITAGELVQVLTGPYSDIESVALDPLPEMVSRGTVGLVSVDRRRFIRRLVERAASKKAAPLQLQA